MKTNIKHFLVIGVFFAFLSFFAVMAIITPDEEYSRSERRALATFPEFSIEKISDFTTRLEEYICDQFVWRDSFRRVKAGVATGILRMSDVNGYALQDGSAYEILYPTNTDQIDRTADLLADINGKYFSEANSFYSIIYDKSYYSDASLTLDYEKIAEIFEGSLGLQAEYIDISEALEFSDYYSTDIHWKQEEILDVAEKIGLAMGAHAYSEDELQKVTLGDFYGVLYGQSAYMLVPDDMIYLTNSTIESATVRIHDTGKVGAIYDSSAFAESDDGYDLFLGGENAIIEMTNPSAETDRKLIVFRDSFARSLLPLLIEDYSQIVVVDLRWIKSTFLPAFSELLSADENTDVLYMYSAQVLNSMLYQ